LYSFSPKSGIAFLDLTHCPPVPPFPGFGSKLVLGCFYPASSVAVIAQRGSWQLGTRRM